MWTIIILLTWIIVVSVFKVKHNQLLWYSFAEPSTQQLCRFLLMFMYYVFYKNVMLCM